jgi:ATP-dependent Zn protease
LITEATNRARIVLKANMKKLEELKTRLLEKESMEAEEVLELLKGSVMPKTAELY